MPNKEEITEEEKNRKKRTDRTRDNNSLIMTAENKKDMNKHEVFDLFSYIKSSRDENAIKLKRLQSYGITDNMILTVYKDLAKNVETEESAIELIGDVFNILATDLSLEPNGVVINLATGLIDYEASFAQAVRVGIYSEDSIIENTDEFITNTLKEILKYEHDANFSRKDAEEYICCINSFNHRNYMEKNEAEIDIKNFENKDVAIMKFSNSMKGFITELRNSISNSEYIKSPYVFEATQLELDLESAKGTSSYSAILSKRDELYQKHPELKNNVPVRKENGEIDELEFIRFEKFKEGYQVQYILSQIDKFKGMTPEQFQNAPTKAKNNIIMATIAGFKFDSKQSEEFKEIVSECTKIFETICPGIDLSDKENPETKRKLAEFAKKEMGIQDDIQELNFNNLIKAVYRQIESVMGEQIARVAETGKIDLDFNDVNIESNISLHESLLRNYFSNSNIEFTKEDEKDFEMLYELVNVNSWIQGKDKALDLRYAGLIIERNKLKKEPSSIYNDKRMIEIENAIVEFESEFGKRGMDGDKLSTEAIEEYKVYSENVENVGLIKYYMRDAMKSKEGKSYNMLDDNDKKIYIRNTLVGLKYLDLDSDYCLSKLAVRRLQDMSTGEKQFVTFDENGEPVVNKELILEEYQSMSEYNYKSFEELEKIANEKGNKYVLKKLGEYSKLREEDFLKLENQKDLKLSIRQIEEVSRTVTPEEIENKNYGSELIGDFDIESGIKAGHIEENVIDASAAVEVAEINGRNESENDQEEAKNSESGAGRNGIAGLSVETIDVSSDMGKMASENNLGEYRDTSLNSKDEKNTFTDSLKKVFKSIKEFVSKYIKKEEKQNLLESGNGATLQNQSVTSNGQDSKFNINEQHHIDHGEAIRKTEEAKNSNVKKSQQQSGPEIIESN